MEGGSGGGELGGRGGGVIHLNLLVFHCPLSSFLFFLSFSFVEPLSEKAMFYTPPHTVHTVCI